MINWVEYYNNLAISESEDYRQVGWGSRESQLSKFNAALKLLPLKDGSRLLDVGCGNAVFEEMLVNRQPFLDVHAIDLSDAHLERAMQKHLPVTIQKGSMLNIPYPGEFFDYVTCIGILQNFNGSATDAVREMARVLKKGGSMFLVTMDSRCDDIYSGKIQKNPQQQYYDPAELGTMLEDSGIKVRSSGAILTNVEDGVVLPIHRWHTFYLMGEKN
jgi:ubiquinone/menaquinone biosynthesis C-methylase UbiE